MTRATAATPACLLGMLLRMAYKAKKYHSGTMCAGVVSGLAWIPSCLGGRGRLGKPHGARAEARRTDEAHRGQHKDRGHHRSLMSRPKMGAFKRRVGRGPKPDLMARGDMSSCMAIRIRRGVAGNDARTACRQNDGRQEMSMACAKQFQKWPAQRGSRPTAWPARRSPSHHSTSWPARLRLLRFCRAKEGSSESVNEPAWPPRFCDE